MGNGRIIEAGQFQYMSAGKGVLHSEFNPSPDEETHLLQIWITPRQNGGEPRYADMDTTRLKQQNALSLFASADGRNGSIAMRQDAEVYFGQLKQGMTLTLPHNEKLPNLWLQMIHGNLEIDGNEINPGDAVSLSSPAQILRALDDAEFILFQLS